MYVCIEVVLRGIGHGIEQIKLVLGEGPNDKVGPMSQPRGTIDTASRTLICTNVEVRFLNQLYSRQLRVTCTLQAVGAAVQTSHTHPYRYDSI